MDLVSPIVTKQGNNYHVQHGDDNGLYVEFFLQPVENKEKSLKEGRPIFEDKEYITIRVLGDKSTVRTRPVTYKPNGTVPADIERFHRQYQAFKSQNAQITEGTPVTEWAAITKSEAMELKALNIHTIESLANCGDNNINWFGGRQLRDKAIAWINQAKDGSGIIKLQEENNYLKTQLEALKNEFEAFKTLPRKGRPPKE